MTTTPPEQPSGERPKGIAVFYDRYWSAQWLVICEMCRDEGSVQPFGQEGAAARTWADQHFIGHAEGRR